MKRLGLVLFGFFGVFWFSNLLVPYANITLTKVFLFHCALEMYDYEPDVLRLVILMRRRYCVIDTKIFREIYPGVIVYNIL